MVCEQLPDVPATVVISLANKEEGAGMIEARATVKNKNAAWTHKQSILIDLQNQAGAAVYVSRNKAR
jgi:hypothetical protein